MKKKYQLPDQLTTFLGQSKAKQIHNSHTNLSLTMTCSWTLLVPLLLLCLPSIYSSTTSDLFETWCISHGKTYASEQEKLYRLKVFEENFMYITQHNNNNNMAANSSSLSYTLSVDNAFADLTHQEFKASRFGLSANGFIRMNLGRSTKASNGVTNIPASLDWRDKGAVTNVKDQGSCGRY